MAAPSGSTQWQHPVAAPVAAPSGNTSGSTLVAAPSGSTSGSTQWQHQWQHHGSQSFEVIGEPLAPSTPLLALRGVAAA